jgi:hypothetical protein
MDKELEIPSSYQSPYQSLFQANSKLNKIIIQSKDETEYARITFKHHDARFTFSKTYTNINDYEVFPLELIFKNIEFHLRIEIPETDFSLYFSDSVVTSPHLDVTFILLTKGINL